MKIVIVSLLSLFSLSQVYSKEHVICLNEHAEPTLGEVLWAALPFENVSPQSDAAEEDSASLPTIPFLQDFLQLRLPFLTFFSSAQYEIRLPSQSPLSSRPPFYFKDISLIEKSYVDFNLLCQLVSVVPVPYLTSWCQCSSLMSLSSEEWKNVSLPAAGTYCLSQTRCDSSMMKSGKCQLLSDPFRHPCLVINSTTEEVAVRDLVSFSLRTPSLYDLLPTAEDLGYTTEDIYGDYHEQKIVWKLLDALTTVLRVVPYHAVCLLLGLAITSQARDLAEHSFMQTNRTITAALWRHGHDGGLALFPADQSNLYPLSKSQVDLAVCSYSLTFLVRRDGLFGYPWLGKVYFLASIGLTFSVSWAFRFFTEDSWSFLIMLYAVRSLGLILLSQGTASRDLSYLLALVGIILEQVIPILRFIFMVIEASFQPRHKPELVLKKKEDIAALSRRTTQQALEQLRQHLQKNPQELQRVTDKLISSGDRRLEATLVQRFAEGSYSGVPRDFEEDESSKGWSRWRKWLWIVGSLVVVVASMAAFVLLRA
eukprot:scaffold2917_cov170-Ochromonas_danica.AAC.4